jgi:hypothetical protein
MTMDNVRRNTDMMIRILPDLMAYSPPSMPLDSDWNEINRLEYWVIGNLQGLRTSQPKIGVLS